MSVIQYLRIYADEEGVSHFGMIGIALESNDYAPPAIPLNTTTLEPADASIFLELPAGWYGDWHHIPVRQWLILMSGECEFEAGDGERKRQRAGDVVMLYDTTGKGHCTRVIGDDPVRIAEIHFS